MEHIAGATIVVRSVQIKTAHALQIYMQNTLTFLSQEKGLLNGGR